MRKFFEKVLDKRYVLCYDIGTIKNSEVLKMTKEYIPNCKTREIDATVKEVLDCREGVVMDSYIAVDKNDELFVVLDTYETAWTSGYTLYRGNEDKLWTIWEKFAEMYDEQFGDDEAEV